MQFSQVIHTSEWVTLVLAIVALFFAGKQFIDAHRQTRALKEHTQELGKIENALSTRFIGTFPQFLGEIIKLIERATKSICIACDCPAYGSFSQRRESHLYRNALVSKLNAEPKVTVNLTCLNPERRNRVIREQFAKAFANWKQWKAEKSEPIKKLLEAHTSHITLEQLTADQLVAMLETDDVRFIDELKGMVEVHAVAADISIYFWVIDEREAIFTVPALTEHVLEYGFITSDHKLIEAFTDLHCRLGKMKGLTVAIEDVEKAAGL